jgi:hypothetical protein
MVVRKYWKRKRGTEEKVSENLGGEEIGSRESRSETGTER